MTRAASDAARLRKLAKMHDHKAATMSRMHGHDSQLATAARATADALRAEAERVEKSE